MALEFMSALKAEFLVEGMKAIWSSVTSSATEIVKGKITADFGGENNPVDEKLDMESSDLMDPDKRLIWNEINRRMNDFEHIGPLTSRERRQMATKRRVLFAAMMNDAPTVKTEEMNDKGKVIKVTHPPLPGFKPLATKVKEYCVDIFLAEQQAQVSAGKSAEEAINVAQEKVEIYLRDAGFPIASAHNPYRHIDEFIVKLPNRAVEAAKATKTLIGKMAVSEVVSSTKATLTGVDSEADTIRNNATSRFEKWRAERRIEKRASR